MDVKRATKKNRRDFLQKAMLVVLAGLYALRPSRHARAAFEKPRKKKVRLGMVIDTRRCIGCRA